MQFSRRRADHSRFAQSAIASHDRADPSRHDRAMCTTTCVSYTCLMIDFLRRVFGCRHLNSVREHREDGWYWACSTCGRAGLLNPREREMPKAVGRYDERKAAAGKARAEKATAQRQAAAARLSEPTYSRKESRTNVLRMPRAK